MRKLIVLPAIALAVGCSMGSQETKKSQTVTAQDQAQQQLQAAADAQKKAADEQKQVEADQRNVQQKQKELADAQAVLRGQRVKAQQAQRDAQQLTEQAQQEATTEQREALRYQKQQAQKTTEENAAHVKDWTSEKNVEGRVVQASSDSVSVRTQDQKLMKLDLSDSTAVNLDGHAAKAAEIKPGSDVRASYQLIDGKARALQLDVTSSRSTNGSSDLNGGNLNGSGMNGSSDQGTTGSSRTNDSNNPAK